MIRRGIGMLDKFGEAIRLLFANAILFSSIILTIWLPGNLLVNYLTFNIFGREEILRQLRITMLIESIFGPIYIAAMIHALSRLKEGQRPTYSEAILVGLRNWGRLFVARLIAGLLILLGLIALIVPGILLLVRYALLDPAVVLEGATPAEARRRSTELTSGIRWQIFGAGLLFLVAFVVLSVVLSFLIYLPLELFQGLDTMAINVVLDCVLDVAFAVIQIVMFLYYWETAREKSVKLGTHELGTHPIS
jgi:hypothetical protein